MGRLSVPIIYNMVMHDRKARLDKLIIATLEIINAVNKANNIF